MRHYLEYADDLRSLMQAWHIDMMGSEAYRYDFCSRRLISKLNCCLTVDLIDGTVAGQFSYVILAYVVSPFLCE